MMSVDRVVRYGVVGVVSTAINYILFMAGIAIGLHYLLAATLASSVTVIAGYFMNRTFTFAAPGAASIQEFASFLGVFVVQYLLAMFGYALLIGCLTVNPSLAFVLNAVAVAAVAFTLLRLHTFRRAGAR
jgi:putative flippase GtrA